MSRVGLGLSLVILVLGAMTPRRPESSIPDVNSETAKQFLATDRARDSKSEPASKFELAVRLDPANPFAWADLGDRYSLKGCTPASLAAYAVALDRAGSLLAVYLRAASFFSRCNEPDQARSTLSGVLLSNPELAAPIFDFYHQRRLADPRRLEASIPRTRPTAEAYVRYLIGKRHAYPDPNYFATLKSAWSFLVERWPESPELADKYVRLLVAEKRYEDARRVWRSQKWTSPTDANLLSNAGFESIPQNWLLDWTISPWPHVESQRDSSVAHSGSASLRIRFDGIANISYSHVAQRVLVRPGRFCLSLWGLAKELTSDQGVGLRFFDKEDESRLNVFVLQFTGSGPWRRLEECFDIPDETRLAELQIIRSASNLPNGRISGTVWIDDVALAAADTGRRDAAAARP